LEIVGVGGSFQGRHTFPALAEQQVECIKLDVETAFCSSPITAALQLPIHFSQAPIALAIHTVALPYTHHSSFVASRQPCGTICPAVTPAANKQQLTRPDSGIFGYINYLVEKDRKYILDTLINGSYPRHTKFLQAEAAAGHAQQC
jgi:F0F1-type ATP synthase gamma subunit